MCTQITDTLTPLKNQTLANQRTARDRFKLLESTFENKMAEEEKASGINPPESIDTEIVVQEVIEKTAAVIHEYSDSSKLMLKRKRKTRCDKVWKHLVKPKYDQMSHQRHVKLDLRPSHFLQRKKKMMLHFVKKN